MGQSQPVVDFEQEGHYLSTALTVRQALAVIVRKIGGPDFGKITLVLDVKGGNVRKVDVVQEFRHVAPFDLDKDLKE